MPSCWAHPAVTAAADAVMDDWELKPEHPQVSPQLAAAAVVLLVVPAAASRQMRQRNPDLPVSQERS